MGLFSYIVHGFGFTIGSAAAREALEKVEALGAEAEANEAAEKERAVTRKRDAEKLAKTRAKAAAAKAKADEQEIDRELAALKKRLRSPP